MKKIMLILALAIAPWAGVHAGTGLSSEGDLCHAEYWWTGAGVDPCLPGLDCVATTFDSGDMTGVCCSLSNSEVGGPCRSCNSTWTTVNTRYQTRETGNYLCGGYDRKKTEYRCAAGYYGSPTSTTSGCTPCPANATCAAGSSTFKCNAGYYANGNGCSQCASPGTSAGGGGITSCYIPSGTTGSDASGAYRYDGNSYWCS
ncbi:MAG: hypothetical protein K2L94_02330 [Alphaproteobacteria bacterium]|nr:hypothetical protein [Alphaproteobacteria bacterium]